MASTILFCFSHFWYSPITAKKFPWQDSIGTRYNSKSWQMRLHKIKKLLRWIGKQSIVNRQPIEWEAIFYRHTTDGKLISIIYKRQNKLNTPKLKLFNQWMLKEMNKQFSRENVLIANKYKKTQCLISFVTCEMQLKLCCIFSQCEQLSSK